MDYALSEGVDLVLFCGDAYQRKDPTQTYQREFAKRLVKLSQAGIPIILVPGNHDIHPTLKKASSVEIFSVLTTSSTRLNTLDSPLQTPDSRLQTPVYTSRRPQLFHISTRSGEVQILSIPWLWRSSLLAREEYRDLSYEDLNQEMSRIIARTIEQEAPKLSPEVPSILASHLWVTGSKVGSEQRYILEKDYSLPPGALAMPAFDYVALGHIHCRQTFDMDPPVVYSGSLERIDFSDEGVPKGFYLVEIDHEQPREKRETRYSFIELPGRQFLTIEVKVSPEDPSPRETLLKELSSYQEKIKGAIVRLQIQWPHPHQPRPPDHELRKTLAGAFLVAGIKWETAQSAGIRLRLIPDPYSLTPLEALSEYLKARKISPQEAAELQSHAEKLLKEVEPQPL